MNDEDRIPNKRPILYELFCPVCGGSVYAIEEEPAYVGRPEVGLNPEGFTVTKLECVLCRETFKIDGIGLRYEKDIADELGWPFPTRIADGPSVIPDRIEKRMRERELYGDSLGQSIDDYYADNLDRSPFPLEKDVLYYVLKRKGKFAKGFSSVNRIVVKGDDDSYNAQILNIGGKYGLERKWLPREIVVTDYLDGDIIESKETPPNGSVRQLYYVVFKSQFCPIAVSNR